jgi:kynureninase
MNIDLMKYVELSKYDILSYEFAEYLDDNDILNNIKDEFIFPLINNKKSIYLCGNSLGLQPKCLRNEIMKQLDKWENQGVEGHFHEPTPWLTIDDTVSESMAKLVGAKKSEVVMMNSLTCNLHLMMTAFYKPTETRYKILLEKKAFPSDTHAVLSQIVHHNFDPSTALLEISPREGEICLHIEDIEDIIKNEGQNIALVLFSGIQYYTGQFFDMKRITNAAKLQGCIIGFDLAHAVGNVPLNLHEIDCDFACWCTYKYMNCGPGSIGGCFVHERHGQGGVITTTSNKDNNENTLKPNRFTGWWGHRQSDRFLMESQFTSCEGANGFRLSNPPVLLISCVRASLDVFEKVLNKYHFISYY